MGQAFGPGPLSSPATDLHEYFWDIGKPPTRRRRVGVSFFGAYRRASRYDGVAAPRMAGLSPIALKPPSWKRFCIVT